MSSSTFMPKWAAALGRWAIIGLGQALSSASGPVVRLHGRWRRRASLVPVLRALLGLLPCGRLRSARLGIVTTRLRPNRPFAHECYRADSPSRSRDHFR